VNAGYLKNQKTNHAIIKDALKELILLLKTAFLRYPLIFRAERMIRMKRLILLLKKWYDVLFSDVGSDQPQALAVTGKRERIPSIDILRGAVILLMILDHVRDFVSPTSFDCTDLLRTTPLWFITRWITHFCAPVFFLLTGVSAAISRKTPKDLSLFLFTRGLFLILLEIAIVNPGFGFPYLTPFFFLQVIWALGCSMIFLAVLVYLPRPMIAVVALALIFGHNLWDGVKPAAPSLFSNLWIILHIPYRTVSKFFILYPLIPWIGVMALGYIMGNLFTVEPEKRKRYFLVIGGAAIIAFAVLRFFNAYGDHALWLVQRRGAVYSLFSFVNTTKYPPSLLFLLMTLGPVLLLYPYLEKIKGAMARILKTFGSVPLFVYIIHLPIAHLASTLIAYIVYGKVFSWLDLRTAPTGYTPHLWLTYLVWFCLIILLLPCASWFSSLKKRKKARWLSYF
jgi:uncharacterized membrane protein